MRTAWTVVCLMALAGNVVAQQGGMRRQQLQRQVMDRLMENYRVQAGLSDVQYERLQAVISNSFQRRSELQRDQRAQWLALEGQMRPGVAADADSVTQLIDSLIDIQEQLIELQRTDQLEYAEFLDPIQRAQLMISTRRLQANVNQIMQRRQGRPPGGGR